MVAACNCEVSVFADDLNTYKLYDRETANSEVLADLGECAARVHEWGAENQVKFDPGKEAYCVLHRTDCLGDAFTLLGVTFDPQLLMGEFCAALASRCSRKAAALLRTRRFYSAGHLLTLYKTHVLSLLELPTPAVYHAAPTHLNKLDSVQERFLHALGFTEEEAFLEHNLAPLHLRRTLAMLGALHRCATGQAHEDMCALFPPTAVRTTGACTRRVQAAHGRQLVDLCDGTQSALLQRSVYGLVGVYNQLPAEMAQHTCVATFQKKLQDSAKERCRSGVENWKTLFSRR